MSTDAPGWVYVITNPAMPDLLKVGFSMKHPSLRADELYHTNNPHSFSVQYEVLVQNPNNLERLVHIELENYNEGKEWFRCKIFDAISAIRKTCSNQKITIIFEQDSSINEDEKAALLAIKNNDHHYFNSIVWDLWPYDPKSNVQFTLYYEYYLKKYGFDKNEGVYYPGDYPDEPNQCRANPETIINLITQQIENSNPISAIFVIDYLISKRILHLNNRAHRIDAIKLYGKNFSLNNDCNRSKLIFTIKNIYMKNGDLFFIEQLTDDFENIQFKLKSDLNNFMESIPDEDYISSLKESLTKYFLSRKTRINEAATIEKVKLLDELFDWCLAKFYEKSWDLDIYPKIRNTQSKVAADLVDLFDTAKMIHAAAQEFAFGTIQKIKEVVDKENLVDLGGLMIRHIDYLGKNDYSEAEKLMLKGVNHSNASHVSNFYRYKGTATQLFNWKLYYTQKIAPQGKNLAINALQIAEYYATGEGLKDHPSKKPGAPKNIYESKNWYSIALSNTTVEKWEIKKPSDKNEMMDYRKKAIEGLVSLACNEGLKLEPRLLEQVREEAVQLGVGISRLPQKESWLSKFF